MTGAAGEGSMRLKALELKDFRGFKELRLQLPEDNLAVLVGVNGAGKSTVLDAATFFLAIFALRMRELSRRFAQARMSFDDIRGGAVSTTLHAAVEMDGARHTWTLKLARDFQSTPSTQGVASAARRILARLDADDGAGVPVLCAYPATRGMARAFRLTSQAPRPSWPQLHAYEQAFEQHLGPFQEFVRWFRLEEDLENEARVRSQGAYPNPRLQAVRVAVERFMNEFPSGAFSNLRAERFSSSAAGEKELLEVSKLVLDKAGEPLALDQLSEGERITLLLVADIARRLAIANPSLPDPLTGGGIVLIDEVDLHLHPQWQRAVLPGLRKAFPNIQLIVTTHSPQVLSRVPSRNVILLKDFQVVGATPPTLGRDANSILEDVMELPARPEESASRIAAVTRLIDEGQLDDARRALTELSSFVGASDPEVVRLGTLIEFLTG